MKKSAGFTLIELMVVISIAAILMMLAAPSFKQYREKDGKFYFKLLDADARLLLQSQGFDSPREAAQTVSLLRKDGATALAGLRDQLSVAPDRSPDELTAALQFFSMA